MRVVSIFWSNSLLESIHVSNAGSGFCTQVSANKIEAKLAKLNTEAMHWAMDWFKISSLIPYAMEGAGCSKGVVPGCWVQCWSWIRSLNVWLTDWLNQYTVGSWIWFVVNVPVAGSRLRMRSGHTNAQSPCLTQHSRHVECMVVMRRDSHGHNSEMFVASDYSGWW